MHSLIRGEEVLVALLLVIQVGKVLDKEGGGSLEQKEVVHMGN